MSRYACAQVLALVAVLALLAGGLPVLVGGSGSGSAPGLAVQAPGLERVGALLALVGPAGLVRRRE